MYTESTLTSGVVPPLVTTGTIAVLPATGTDTITTLAIGVFAGLSAWAIIYLYTTKHVS